ncbi:MAG: riboflavin biosynthesis protein RibF [Candidatus Omnitrophica bacterium]|nr:riboflavin biosynthesis protein RibF [Candidatus Omnitrophota bacterium]
MKVIYRLKEIRGFKNSVVTLGVFDGVHRAHHKILKAVVEKAKEIKGTSLVVTFWPDPHKDLSLYSLQDRLRLIEKLGIDVCVVIRFNKRFALISPEDFIKEILIKRIGAKYIYVGQNFRFGRNREGDLRLLQRLSCIYNFKVKIFKLMKIKKHTISSSTIRKLIAQGKLEIAQKMLFTPVTISGVVIKGTSFGKRLGFPTANISPYHQIIPPNGVYAVRVILEQRSLDGICYIGTKPTFKRQRIKPYIEVHLFNFSQDIYGRKLMIQFIKKIRNEKRFSSCVSLAEQIRKDILQTKRLFSSA